MTEHSAAHALSELENMRASRDVDAVVRMQILKVEAASQGLPILMYEGDDDKIVYSRWIMRIRPELRYSIYVCEGKNGVRKANRVVSRDRSGLSDRVYFFVDRDFDDLARFASPKNVFMCEYYSIENYLVYPEMVDMVLRDEFPCHDRPEVRRRIVDMFTSLITKFHTASAAVNFRIYCSRVLPIEEVKRTTSKCSAFVSVSLDKVDVKGVDMRDIVPLSREPSSAEISALIGEFLKLDAATRYRGKFIYSFFKSWLEALFLEFSKRSNEIFEDVRKEGLRRDDISLGSFASRSRLPAELPAFVHSIA